MAVASAMDRFTRRVSLAVSGNEALKGTLLSAASSLWFLLFLLLPMGIIVLFGFTTVNPRTFTITYDRLTLENYSFVLNPVASPVLTLTVWTFFVSALTVVGSLAVGYPVAYYLARVVSEKHRGLFISLIIIPFWVSFVVQVYALYPWIQRQGYIGQAVDAFRLGGLADGLFENLGFGSKGIVPIVLIWIWIPFLILPVFASLLKIDRELLEAAQDLGAGKWRTFRHVIWPLSLPGVITGSILVFITAFGSFVEPALVGGQEAKLIGNYIYLNFLELGALPTGAAASVIVLGTTVIVLWLYAIYAEEAASGFGRRSLLSKAVSQVWERLSDAFARRMPSPDNGGGHGRSVAQARGPLERLFDRLGERHGKGILRAFTILVLITFYVPLVQVALFSFNESPNTITWGGFSLKWYVRPPGQVEELRALFNDKAMLDAMINSFAIGLAVTALSLLIGTPAALAIVRYRFGSRSYLNLMLYTGLVIPSIVLGVALLVFITWLNDLYLWPYGQFVWETGYLSIIVGHVTFAIPIVIVVLIVSLREFDRSIEEAAMDLGADELKTFFLVTLPVIKPGLVAAALLSFTFSFDEVIVTLFTKGQGIETLPVVMWSTLFKKIPSPELNAASTLILGIAIVFTLLANKVQRGGTMFRF